MPTEPRRLTYPLADLLIRLLADRRTSLLIRRRHLARGLVPRHLLRRHLGGTRHPGAPRGLRRFVAIGFVVLVTNGAPAVGSVPEERTGSPPGSQAGSISSTGSAVWPLDPRPHVVAGFDPPSSAYGAGHRGVDLAGTAGQTVRAARAGRVTYAGTLAGRGVVVVDHGTTRTTYEPVAAEIRVGATVTVGETLGELETRNGHCWPGTCLHWGLIEGATYRNPLSLVGAGPVRLLPLAPLLPLPASGRTFDPRSFAEGGVSPGPAPRVAAGLTVPGASPRSRHGAVPAVGPHAV